MQIKECLKEDSRCAAQGAEGKTNKSPRKDSLEKAKMPPKDNETARPVHGQSRKRRLVPAKALPIEGMREAAQLARSYMRAIETHNHGNQGRQIVNLRKSPGLPFPYDHLLQFPGSMVNASTKLFPQDISLINQLHTSGTVPCQLLNVTPGVIAANKRPFSANAAEESRMKRLRKIVDSTTDGKLGPQAAIARYGGSNDNSPLLPSPPAIVRFFDSGHQDPSFLYFHKSPPAQYSSDPPSPTPRKASVRSKLAFDMRLDSSAFPSTDKLDVAADGFYYPKDNQIKRPARVPVSQHMSAKYDTENHRKSMLQLPSNNLRFSQLDGIRHMTSIYPQDGTLTSPQFDSRSHMIPTFVSDEQKSQVTSDGVYLGHMGQGMALGLPQFTRPELAAYLGHLATLRNLPQHESSTHLATGQHQDVTNRPNSLPNNPSAGILPLPVRPELNGSTNNLNSLAYLSPDAGILPLPGRPELAQMASLQQELTGSQGFNGSQHSLRQPVQLQSLQTQGDLASFQQELPGQRSAVTGNHLLFPSHQVHHLQYMNQELPGQTLMGNHSLLPPLGFPNDLATLQQELSAQQFNSQIVPLQGDLSALQQDLSAQGLPNYLVHPSPLPSDLASLQFELLSQRLNAGQHPLLHPVPMQGNLALLQQDLAAHGLSGGHHPIFQSFPQQGDLSALQQELDFQRLNPPLVQASIQQQLSAQNFSGGQHPLLQTPHM